MRALLTAQTTRTWRRARVFSIGWDLVVPMAVAGAVYWLHQDLEIIRIPASAIALLAGVGALIVLRSARAAVPLRCARRDVASKVDERAARDRLVEQLQHVANLAKAVIACGEMASRDLASQTEFVEAVSAYDDGVGELHLALDRASGDDRPLVEHFVADASLEVKRVIGALGGSAMETNQAIDTADAIDMICNAAARDIRGAAPQ